MGALVGAFGPDAPARPAQTMLDAMRSRADSHRETKLIDGVCEFGVGFHHMRPGAPLYDDGEVMIAFDGRLDRGPETGAAGATIAGVFRQSGVAGFAALAGDYAFALWDRRSCRLVLARDVVGSRPLYYRKASGALLFGSEERALFRGGELREVSETRIAQFLLNVPIALGEGFHVDVRKVKPGHAVISDGRETTEVQFDVLAKPQPSELDGEAQIKGLRAHLQRAVQRRVEREPIVDCLLSGGLDSSSVAVLAANAAEGPVRTLSVVFDAKPDLTERPFIESVLKRSAFSSRFYDASALDPFSGVTEMLVRQGQLVNVPNQSAMFGLVPHMRPGGVLLDGHGGDEVISKGGGHLLDLVKRKAWISLYFALRAVSGLYGHSAAAMWRDIYLKTGPGRYKIARALALAGWNFQPEIGETGIAGSRALAAEFRQRVDPERLKRNAARPRGQDGREADLSVLLDPFQSTMLEIIDRETQYLGIETRCPFWDRELIRYSMSLPAASKIGRGWTRLILRRAMRQDLPSDVLWRRDKHDFNPHLQLGLRRSDIVTESAFEAMRVQLSPFVDVDEVISARRRLDDAGTSPGDELHTLWRLGVLMIWLRLAAADGVSVRAADRADA